MKSGDASFEKASLNYDYKIHWMQNVGGEFNIESIGIWSQFSQFISYDFLVQWKLCSLGYRVHPDSTIVEILTPHYFDKKC